MIYGVLRTMEADVCISRDQNMYQPSTPPASWGIPSGFSRTVQQFAYQRRPKRLNPSITFNVNNWINTKFSKIIYIYIQIQNFKCYLDQIINIYIIPSAHPLALTSCNSCCICQLIVSCCWGNSQKNIEIFLGDQPLKWAKSRYKNLRHISHTLGLAGTAISQQNSKMKWQGMFLFHANTV